MIKRKELMALREWAASKDRKPLVLRGARQVGKTTLVNEFAKEFDSYIPLNLERANHARLFERITNTRDLLMEISLTVGQPVKERTLLFIDEIQNSPKAVAQLRYFYEDMPELYVIAAGSLLESLLDMRISFPVGRVQYLMLRPCCFLEFLEAMGKPMIADAIREHRISETIHPLVMNMFKQYTLIGGMPEVVSHYAEHQDVVSLHDFYETLLTSYRDDVEKYGRNATNREVIRHLLTHGWSYAGTRITLVNFGNSSYKSREVGEAFRTLEKTHLLELVYPTTNVSLPLLQESKRAPKLLWVDTGIVNYVAHLQTELVSADTIEDAWRGCIAEQIVGQELLTLNHRPSYHRDFWVRGTSGSTSEVDFVLLHQDKIIPVEVKSGSNSKQKSLAQFMELAEHDIAIRVSSKPFHIRTAYTPSGKPYRFINLPFYYISVIHDVVAELGRP